MNRRTMLGTSLAALAAGKALAKAPSSEPEPEPEPEPIAAAPEPEAEAMPDPNEVSGKPAAPRRGWWRRGG